MRIEERNRWKESPESGELSFLVFEGSPELLLLDPRVMDVMDIQNLIEEV